jgi:lipopolysaccharide/colanic/teichoic acid biosynthesis glycosyltransferase
MHWKVRVAKRTLDVVGSAIGLALTAPLFPLIAAAIKLDSRGPVLYRQRRARTLVETGPAGGGQGVRFDEFEMAKFRTMCVDAEKGMGAVIARPGDPRVTRVGKWLRRTRLDELPQLWSVLRGDMSLVGPRPERPELLQDLALAIPLFEERMRDVKPGLTGFAQINLGYAGEPLSGSEIERLHGDLVNPFKLEEARGALADDLRLKLLYDLAYTAALDSVSSYVRTEAEIILKTPVVMLRGLGR